MTKQISEGRKTAYYFGIGLGVVGFLLFFSVFITGAMNFGNFNNFRERASSEALRAVVGMALMITGGIISSIGAKGLSGSGVVLDPEKARSDLEPYSRMAGGMVKDALDEADINIGSRAPEKVVMLKCRECGKLNEEDSRFCQECGNRI